MRTFPDIPNEHKCANCGTQASGQYCSNCGQPAHALQMPIGAFLKDALHELFGLDSRLFRTLVPLLFKPGFVSRDYISGHRARYVPPLRLYIFLSFLLFLTLAFASDDENSRIAFELSYAGDSIAVDSEPADRSGELVIAPFGLSRGADTADVSGAAESEFERRIQRAVEDPRGFMKDFRGRLAQAMFFLLPLFALELKVLYRRRYFVEHLVFSVYFHCFVFAVVVVSTAPRIVGLDGVSNTLDYLLLAVPIYLVAGMKKVYQQGVLRTAAKASFLTVLHTVILVTTLVGVFLITVQFA